ncbi:hypothetical protein Q7O_000211 [Pectobacterium carotovorum subsp. carotovorum PCCS1]|nr:hypothetical protein [Pectobacterium carotovorum subsp. carotovorum PCCS1]
MPFCNAGRSPSGRARVQVAPPAGHTAGKAYNHHGDDVRVQGYAHEQVHVEDRACVDDSVFVEDQGHVDRDGNTRIISFKTRQRMTENPINADITPALMGSCNHVD